jgi:hypothetical protein
MCVLCELMCLMYFKNKVCLFTASELCVLILARSDLYVLYVFQKKQRVSSPQVNLRVSFVTLCA